MTAETVGWVLFGVNIGIMVTIAAASLTQWWVRHR